MAQKKRDSTQSREAILQAATRVIKEQGANHLTLEVVAEEAGMSKGGLLYHFPSKVALLEGMLERVMDRFLRFRDEALDSFPECSNLQRLLRVRAQMHAEVSGSILLGILAAAAERPRLLDTVRPIINETLTSFQGEHVDPIAPLVIWLASEGLSFYDLMNLGPLDGGQRKAVEERLSQMASALARHPSPKSP